MAFKHNAGTMMGRYNEHQSLAKSRLSKTASMTPTKIPPVSQMCLDTRNTHGALPKQVGEMNRTQTIQTDLHKQMDLPKGLSMNRSSTVKSADSHMQKRKGIK